MLLLSWLVLVLDLEEVLSILDAEVRDDRNSSEDFVVVQQVVAVAVLEDLPCLETPVDRLMVRLHMTLYSLIGDRVARVVRAHDLVHCAGVAVVGLNAIAWLEEVAEDLVKDLDGRVRSIDPHKVPPKDTHPNLMSVGGLPCILVGCEGIPRDAAPSAGSKSPCC